MKTRHRRRRHTDDRLWPGLPSVTLGLGLITRQLGAKGQGAPLPAPDQFCEQGCPPSGMEKFDEITHLFIYVCNLFLDFMLVNTNTYSLYMDIMR